ncbi:MAG: hypothetical protein J2P17_16715 [Mycobacterium sp.]|nr:hypothetical protein [Mycobacterium sp.]
MFAECVQLGVLRAALVFKFGESVPQSFSPGVGDVVSGGCGAIFAFVEQVVLAADDFGDRLLDRGDPLFEIVAVAGVVATELMAQKRGAVGAEHSLVEEGLYAFE